MEHLTTGIDSNIAPSMSSGRPCLNSAGSLASIALKPKERFGRVTIATAIMMMSTEIKTIIVATPIVRPVLPVSLTVGDEKLAFAAADVFCSRFILIECR
jgi:hypothetical protein